MSIGDHTGSGVVSTNVISHASIASELLLLLSSGNTDTVVC